MVSRDGLPPIPTDEPLSLASGLRTRIDSVGHVLVETHLGGIVDAGPDGLAVLAAFARPRTFAEAMLVLASESGLPPSLIQVRGTVATLYAAGAIITGREQGVRFGWTDPAEHARMVSDTHRTDAFIAALEATVQPDDVVLDIGTGSGVLAVAAARCDARHVYAIEASDIATVAREVFVANDVAERVTLIEGWSTEVELPEPATVLVTETLGVEPFEEDILRTVIDARGRLLTPGARLIPQALQLTVQAVTVPDGHRWSSRIDRRTVDAWRDRYGIDLEPLYEARRPTPLHWPVDGQIVATWPAMSPRVGLLELDLRSVGSTDVRAGTTVPIERSGTVDAVVVTFSARLAQDVVLAQRPRVGQTSSWDASVWFLPDGREVEAGDRLSLGYRFGSPGEADGLSCELSPRRRDRPPGR